VERKSVHHSKPTKKRTSKGVLILLSQKPSVVRIDNFGDMLSLENQWNALLKKSNIDSPFMTFEFISTWWKHFGDDSKLFVLAVYDGEQLVGIAPLMQKKRSIFRVLQFIGTGDSEYLGFVTVGDKQRVVQTILDYLIDNRSEWDVINLYHMPFDQFSNTNAVDGRTLKIFSRAYSKSSYLSLDGSWEDFLQTQSRSFRKDIKRIENKLAKAGNPELVCYVDPISAAKLFDILSDIEAQSWKAQSGNLFFNAKNARGFFTELLGKFARRVWLEGYVLKLDGEPIATELNFSYNNKIYSYSGNFSKKYAKLSPGRLVMSRTIRSAFERGFTEFDFLEGIENYKSRWMTGQRSVHQAVITKKSLYSRAAYFFLFKAKWMLKKRRTMRKLKEASIKYCRKITQMFGVQSL